MSDDQNSQDQNACPPQHPADQPGAERKMTPAPEYQNPDYRGSWKLDGKAALINGGDVVGG